LRPQGDLTRDPPRRTGVPEEARRPITAVDRTLALDSPRQARARPPVDDVLPSHHFLNQLEREKRRTDRSRVSLSMVLFRFDHRLGDPL
jgi:hypothetical protein